MTLQRAESEVLAEAYSDEAKSNWKAPVQGYGGGIPWPIHLEAYDVYCKKYSSQVALIDLKGRGCRGGFHVGELDDFIPGWRERVDIVNTQRNTIAELQRRVQELETELVCEKAAKHNQNAIMSTTNVEGGCNMFHVQLTPIDGSGVIETLTAHTRQDLLTKVNEFFGEGYALYSVGPVSKMDLDIPFSDAEIGANIQKGDRETQPQEHILIPSTECQLGASRKGKHVLDDGSIKGVAFQYLASTSLGWVYVNPELEEYGQIWLSVDGAMLKFDALTSERVSRLSQIALALGAAYKEGARAQAKFTAESLRNLMTAVANV